MKRAIRERGFRQEDYDSFLVVLVVGQKKELPDWLPSIVIYFDPLKDGVGTAVTVIETRRRGLGKDVQPESASEKAKRIDRQLEWEAKRREILFQNRDSVKFANNEAGAFLTTLVTRVKEISDGSGSLSISARETGGQYGGLGTILGQSDNYLALHFRFLLRWFPYAVRGILSLEKGFRLFTAVIVFSARLRSSLTLS